MRLALIIFATLLQTTWLLAQQDSLASPRIYRSLLQELALPALVADNGKHVVQVNTVYQVNAIRSIEQPFQSFQAIYRTQWRKHGFGWVYQGLPGSTIWSNSVGLQYGFGFGFKSRWLRNSKLSLGLGVNFTKVQTDFSQMVFVDQINPTFGVVRPSRELDPTTNVLYPGMEAGLLFRSQKLFLGVGFANMNEPSPGFYKTAESQSASTLILNTGIKLMEWKRISSWLTFDERYSKHELFMKLGITLAYQNKYLLTCYQTRWDGPHFRLAYSNNHIRTFAQYQYTKNDYVGYWDYGNLSLGMAYAIGKQ